MSYKYEFKINPDKSVYYKYYIIWKSRIGYSGSVNYSRRWHGQFPEDKRFWSLTKYGVRRKIAKWITKHRKADQRYRRSVYYSD